MPHSSFCFGIRGGVRRWCAGAACWTAISLASLSAADIPVNRIDDTGVGSLRQGLAGSVTGDRLAFDPVLNNTTLTNGAPLTVNNAVTLLDINNINVTDAHAYTLAVPLTVNWAGTLTLNGVLSNGIANGSLVNSGLGTLVLSGTNTYAGGTTINGGTIQVLNNSALGTGALTATNTVGTPTLELGNGINLSNAMTLQTALTVNTATGFASQLSGIISGTAATDSLTTTGGGILTLSGANTFIGGVNVTNDSTINLQNSAGFGTGIVKNTGELTLQMANGLSVANNFTLGNNLIGNVSSGAATLSGNIGESSVSQLTKTGAGTLVLSGTNSFTGGIVVSAGTLQGTSSSLVGNITDNSSLVFNQSGTGAYGGNISGTGELTKNGSGTLIFNGNSVLTSITTINAGELQVNGSISGPVRVASAAGLLSGTGNVGTVVNDGHVQPGTITTIGTLNVNGNYNQQADGVTEIKVNSAGNTPGVNNDHIVVSGTASLGGSLNVITTGGGVFVPGTQYTIMNAAGGMNGQFSQVFTNLSMFGVDVTYGANDVTFELLQTTSLKAAAETGNQLAVGTALDNIALTSTGGLFAMINTLGIQSPADQRASMNQLSGEVYGNLQTLGLQLGDQFQQKMSNIMISNGTFLMGQTGLGVNGGPAMGNPNIRGQSPQYESARTWAQGFGAGGSFASDGNSAGMNFNQGGVLVGVDVGDDESGRIGFAGGSSLVNFRDGFDANGLVTNYEGGMYAIRNYEAHYFMSTVNYGYNWYQTNRNVSIAGVNQVLQGDFSGSQIGASAETGLKLWAGPVQVQPLIGLQYLYLCQQGFEETGGVAALDAARSRANSLRANVGARVSVNQWQGPRGSIWTPYTQVRFVGDMLNNDRLFNAQFVGSPAGGSFISHGTRIGQVYGLFGQGAEVRLNDTWSLYGNVDVVAGDRVTSATGSLTAVTYW